MADKVMRMEQPVVQLKPLSITSIQRKCEHCEEEEKQMQRKETNGDEASADNNLESYVGNLKSGGQSLPDEVRNFYEPRFGFDFSNVKVHTDSVAAKSAQSINALAYTFGNNIVFNNGHYAPHTVNGRKLLGHELTHVVQQQHSNICRRPEPDVITSLNQLVNGTPPDINGYMQVLRTEGGIHAAGAALRTAIEGHFTSSLINVAQAWRATCLQLLGDESAWPIVLRNFVTGIEGGQFIVPGTMPVNNAEQLREIAISTAHLTSAPSTTFSRYQAAFNAQWENPVHHPLSEDFDPTLDSKGPRNQKARAIFNQIYTGDPAIRTAYDSNTGGIRERIDEFGIPDFINSIASPRIASLRTLFRTQALITSANLLNAAYVAFKTRLHPVTQLLDVNERAEITNSHRWQLIIDATVRALALKSDLISFIDNDWITVAPAAPVAPLAPAAAVVPPLVLNAAQQTFVNNLVLNTPNPVIISPRSTETLSFTPASTVNPSGLIIQSGVEVTPSRLVTNGQITLMPWAPASTTGGVHHSTVTVDGGAPGFVEFTGTLRLISPAGTINLPASPQAIVRINDDRQNWFSSHMAHGLQFSDQNEDHLWTPGSTVEYYGGQQALQFEPFLPADNPDLTVFVRGNLTKNGAVNHTMPILEFGNNSRSRSLGGKNVIQSTPVPALADPMVLTLEFLRQNIAGAVPFHTIVQPFAIDQGTVFTAAQLLAQASSDFTLLNAQTPGSIIDDMIIIGGQAERVARAIISGAVKLEPTLVRHDTARFLSTHGGNPRTESAYLLGHTIVDAAHTLTGQPNADGWRTSSLK